MLDIKNTAKTIQIITWNILDTHLVLKCILKRVKGKRVISAWMSYSFQIIEQLILN